MDLPQEVEVWYVIPAIRKELTKKLINLGLNQKEIAKKLSITEPAVSQYLSGKRGKEIKFNTSIIKEITISARKIINNFNTNKEIVRLTNVIRKTCLCKIHKDLDRNRKGCEICKR